MTSHFVCKAASLLCTIAFAHEVLSAETRTLVVRLPANTLLKYESYKDVSIIHFDVPDNSILALFTFKSEIRGFGCSPVNVSVHIKPGSYPVISPENVTFPKTFLNMSQRYPTDNLHFKSDGKIQYLNVTNPKPGDWFGVGFLSWTDPKNDRIEQQGLTAKCEVYLISELSVVHDDAKTLEWDRTYEEIVTGNQSARSKFYIGQDANMTEIEVQIQNSDCSNCTDLKIELKSYEKNIIIKEYNISIDDYEMKTLELVTEKKNQWFLISVMLVGDTLTKADNANVTILLKQQNGSALQNEVTARPDFKEYPLFRQTFPEFFMFDYDLIPDDKNIVPTALNLTSKHPASFKFTVNPIHDIGGSLTFGVALKLDFLNYGNLPQAQMALRNKVKTVNALKTPRKDVNMTVVVCMRLDKQGTPIYPNLCEYGTEIESANAVVNNSNEDAATGLVNVPFPEPGTWIVTLGLFCDGKQTVFRNIEKEYLLKNANEISKFKKTCHCTKTTQDCIDRTCLNKLANTEVNDTLQCMFSANCSDNYANLTRKFDDFKNNTPTTGACETSSVFLINSSPCIAGKCARYGRCFHYMSGGFVFSTCICSKNYRGWDCSDDSEVLPSSILLMETLFLTLSNLLFVVSMLFAIRRKYYTEAIIYFATMFFSTFYHACDAGEDEYSYCLVKLSVLQFADFYCGLLSIWVTLVAMANLTYKQSSMLHMTGAVLLAFGTELNKQALWVFLVPALTGVTIVSLSWGLHYRKIRQCYPSLKYLQIFFPMGLGLVSIGLVCYAFLQTKQNYAIVHSVWHMIMAISILCLLPSELTFVSKSNTNSNLINENNFVTTDNRLIPGDSNN